MQERVFALDRKLVAILKHSHSCAPLSLWAYPYYHYNFSSFFLTAPGRHNHLLLNDMASADQFWCTGCNAFRDASEFGKKAGGQQRKTCFRHTKKRTHEGNHSWKDFIYQIRAWNCPVSIIYNGA